MTLYYLWLTLLPSQATLHSNAQVLLATSNNCLYFMSPQNGAFLHEPMCFPSVEDVLPLNDSFLILANGYLYKVSVKGIEDKTFVGFQYKYILMNDTVILCGYGCKTVDGRVIYQGNVTERPYIFKNYLLIFENDTLKVIKEGRVVNSTYVGRVGEVGGCENYLAFTVNDTINIMNLSDLPKMKIVFKVNGTLFAFDYKCGAMVIWDNGYLKVFKDFKEVAEGKISKGVISLALINDSVFVAFINNTVMGLIVGYPPSSPASTPALPLSLLSVLLAVAFKRGSSA